MLLNFFWNGPLLKCIYFTCNGIIQVSIMWKSFINVMSNESNPPYIRPHVVVKMHKMTYPDTSYEKIQINTPILHSCILICV